MYSHEKSHVSNSALRELLKEACPVFKDGCPYSNASKSFSDEVSRCPVFAEKCPFKDLDGAVAALTSNFDAHIFMSNSSKKSLDTSVHHTKDKPYVLKEVCPAFKEGCPFKSVPESLREEMMKCPSFSAGCPFKNLCANGEPLVVSLGKRRWDVYIPSLTDESEREEKKKKEEEEKEEKEIVAEPLAIKLKEGTKDAHRLAETSRFVKRFRNGTIPRKSYADFVAALYFIYSVMEDELEKHKDIPSVGAIHFPTELNRKKALEKDLQFWFGENWKEKISPSKAASQYVERLRYCGKEQPSCLIAHSYTRYLGDMSGGQILKRLVHRCFKDLKKDEGTSFYDFENISITLRKFKENYRKQLDSFKIDMKEIENIVTEANIAFILNMQLFNELEGEQMSTEILSSEFIKKLHENASAHFSTKKSKNSVSVDNNSDDGSASCPFASLSKRKDPPTVSKKQKTMEPVPPVGITTSKIPYILALLFIIMAVIYMWIFN